MMAPQGIRACLDPILKVLELYLSCRGQLWMQVPSLGAVGVAWTHCILGASQHPHQAEGRLGMELTPSGDFQGTLSLWHSQLCPKTEESSA